MVVDGSFKLDLRDSPWEAVSGFRALKPAMFARSMASVHLPFTCSGGRFTWAL